MVLQVFSANGLHSSDWVNGRRRAVLKSFVPNCNRISVMNCVTKLNF